MGSGRWDSKVYVSNNTSRAASGIPDFKYDSDVKTGKVSGVNPDLDPRKVAGPASALAGQPVRESRDSEEHPETVPICVIFDVTGSMGSIPMMLQKKLAGLMDVIMGKAGLAHPQIMIGAVGDATCDRYPLQLGQFESDNRLDEQLRKLILEGGGGGQIMESYGLAYYFAARHAFTDAWEKRSRKGYLFTIGDEKPWGTTHAEHLRNLFGISEAVDATIEHLVTEAQERWLCYHIHSNDGSYKNHPEVLGRWRELLGPENVIVVDDSALVCEVIAGIIHSCETAADLDAVTEAVGVSGSDALVVRSALATLAVATPASACGPPLPASYRRPV